MTVTGSVVDGYTAAMSRLRLRVVSPRQAVSITASGGVGTTVTVQPSAMRTLTARGMADEVAAAVEAVLTGYAKAQSMALENTANTVTARGRRAVEQQRRISEIDVIGHSRDNRVRLIRRGEDGAVRAEVTQAAMSDTAEALSVGVQQAMISLAGAHRRARMEVYMRNAREFLSTAPQSGQGGDS
ncbi:MAG TPA: hypothetical protein H9881_05385 [Candidatus Stackebrandtia excrementipullorum]|nr:hypothetical protein [Candidatus Stackebrandtia excrementipullorum]